jgi:hypothetical protein
MHAEDWARVESRLAELEETNFELLRKLEIARACLFRIQTVRFKVYPNRTEWAPLEAAEAYKASRP